MAEPTIPAPPPPWVPAPAPMPAPSSARGASSAPRAPRRLSRVALVAVVASLGLLIGAAALANRAGSDRRAALAHRDQVQAQAQAQAVTTARDESQLATIQAEMTHLNAALVAPLATVADLRQLVDQGLTAAQDAHQAALAGNVADYNAAIDRANAVTGQFNAASARLSDELDQLPSR